MAKETVAQVSKRLDRYCDEHDRLTGAIVDKIDVMMERQGNDHAILEKHTEILQNGLSDKVSRAVSTAVAQAIEEQRRKEWEEEREERRIQLEEQKVRNEQIGRQKDRTNRLMIAAVPIATGLIMWLVNRLG